MSAKQLRTPGSGDTVATMHTNHGDIKILMLPEFAPKTVENFTTHAKNGYYNGLTFHRIMEGFVLQGGDPKGDGTGGSDTTIKGEFSINGVKNNLSHIKGVISMARSADKNSASSQFFICHADAKFLDGQYAGFGKVVEGIETVDKIASVATNYNDKPLTPQVMSKVYFVTK